MLVLLSGGPFDGVEYDVRTNFQSTLHITDPSLPPIRSDPRTKEAVSFRYRPGPRKTDDGRAIYDYVADKQRV
ncbi:hypothetical protein AYO38_05905 [bacterium SCGC AG-212-C10]|nr:hypothetical protein AYO38_05905 [bacterium SCGC AG-212-C10]